MNYTYCPCCRKDYNETRMWGKVITRRAARQGCYQLAPLPCPWCGFFRSVHWDRPDHFRLFGQRYSAWQRRRRRVAPAPAWWRKTK